MLMVGRERESSKDWARERASSKQADEHARGVRGNR